jgi:pyruvate/2-oxoglutarate dehydrogenase complex dihydrolipoamide dehydrogenase (E3) component
VDYDLVVIGGGAAGISAARVGVAAGARTALINDGPPGGDCTFVGCVPSKTLIESAAQGTAFATAMARVRNTVGRIAATEDAATLGKEGIQVLGGRAVFTSPRQVLLDGRPISARRFVLASGSRPAIPPIPGLDAVAYLTNETVFDLTERPSRLAVLGGGAIGCELAQAFARLGTRVTVIEAAPRLLPREEPEVSQVLARVFADEGVTVRIGSSVAQVQDRPHGCELMLPGGPPVVVDAVLVAVGRAPATAGLGLEAAGVQLDERGFVRTTALLGTTATGIYAAGDVTGRAPFTHAAYAMGRLAARNAMRRRRARFDTTAVPWVTFTSPEVAHVGSTEAHAAKQAPGARVAYLPMAELDRALTAGRSQGFVKLITGPRRLVGNAGGGRLLGATIVADRAGEMIHEAVLAMRTGMFTGRLAQAVHAYPTWSMAIQLAAAQFFGEFAGRAARPAQRDQA